MATLNKRIKIQGLQTQRNCDVSDIYSLLVKNNVLFQFPGHYSFCFD